MLVINGEHHRDGDLPAIEWVNGDKYWFKNCKQYHPTIYMININVMKIKIIKMGDK